MTTEIRRIDSDPVINELLGRGHFDKRLRSMLLQAVRENQRFLIVIAAAFGAGVALGFRIGANGTGKSMKGSEDK